MDFEQLLPTIQEYSIKYGLALLEAVLIFVIGKFAAGIVANIIDKVMKRSGMDDMLRKFLRNIAYGSSRPAPGSSSSPTRSCWCSS